MVFRLVHGGVKENLVLTAITSEWHRRNPSEPLFLETSMPELFIGNTDLAGVGPWFDAETIIDFDLLNDAEFDSHIMDLYAFAALGDNRLLSRRMILNFSQIDLERHSVLVGEIFAKRHPEIFQSLQGDKFVVEYNVDKLAESISLLKSGDVFVGCDEDITWIAMTTDIPIVMLSGPRLPKQVRPFREGRPFETVASKCEFLKDCMKRFSSLGFGNVYHVCCRRELEQSCEALVTFVEVADAMQRVLEGKNT